MSHFLQDMGIMWGTISMVSAIFILLMTGLPLAFVTGLVALFFTIGWFGPNAISLITSRVYGFITGYSLIAVPMFVLMASLLDRSGIARDLYTSMKVLAGKLRGGLAIQTIFVAFILAAMSGIIGGEIVLLGLLALPQMLRLGYNKKLAIGVVCAGGSLGTMVPPSLVLIIYGLMTNVPISDLFVATVPAAAILASSYIIYILIRCYSNKDFAPIEQGIESLTFKEKLYRMRHMVPPAFIASMVLGSIYLGVASVTEAASMGVVTVIIVVIFRKELTFKLLKDSAIQTLNTTGAIIWIGIGASMIVGVYNLMGGNLFVKNLILGLDIAPILIIIFMMVILAILGLFLDWVGIAMLTMPIFVPIVIQLGYDPVWFGILFAVNMQISFLSPPFGPAVFYLKGVAPEEVSLSDIYHSVLPFIGLQAIVLGILLVFPQLITWIL